MRKRGELKGLSKRLTEVFRVLTKDEGALGRNGVDTVFFFFLVLEAPNLQVIVCLAHLVEVVRTLLIMIISERVRLKQQLIRCTRAVTSTCMVCKPFP